MLGVSPRLSPSTESWGSKASPEGAPAGVSQEGTSPSTALTASPGLAWPLRGLAHGCLRRAGCYSQPHGYNLLPDFSCWFCFGSAVMFLHLTQRFSWCNRLEASSSFFLSPCLFYPAFCSLISERLPGAPCWVDIAPTPPSPPSGRAVVVTFLVSGPCPYLSFPEAAFWPTSHLHGSGEASRKGGCEPWDGGTSPCRARAEPSNPSALGDQAKQSPGLGSAGAHPQTCGRSGWALGWFYACGP